LQRSALWTELRITPAGFPRQAQNEGPDLEFGTWPATFPGLGFGWGLVGVKPAEKGAGRDDGDQFPDGLAQRLAALDDPRSVALSERYAFGQLAAQDLRRNYSVEATSSTLETPPQMRVVRENLLCFRQHVAAREDGVIALLDRRRGPDRLQPLRPGERVRRDRVPEPGHVEQAGNPVGIAALQDAHEVRGDADL